MCISVLCDLELPRITYYVISRNPEKGRLACSKMSLIQKTAIYGPINMYIYSYLDIYPTIDKSRSCVSTKIRFYFTQEFFIYFQINISQIYTVSTIWKKNSAQHLKRYVTTCFQIRSRIVIFIFFGYVPGLYFISSHMWQLFT